MGKYILGRQELGQLIRSIGSNGDGTINCVSITPNKIDYFLEIEFGQPLELHDLEWDGYEEDTIPKSGIRGCKTRVA